MKPVPGSGGNARSSGKDCYPAKVRLRSVNLTVRLAVEFWGLCWLLGFLSAYLSNGAATMGGLSAVLAWWIAIWRQERRARPGRAARVPARGVGSRCAS